MLGIQKLNGESVALCVGGLFAPWSSSLAVANGISLEDYGYGSKMSLNFYIYF